MKEFLMIAFLAVFSDVVVPRVTELTAGKPKPEAEETEPAAAKEASEGAEVDEAEPGEAAEAEEDSGDEVERLREENRILKELVAEKEVALRRAED